MKNVSVLAVVVMCVVVAVAFTLAPTSTGVIGQNSTYASVAVETSPVLAVALEGTMPSAAEKDAGLILATNSAKMVGEEEMMHGVTAKIEGAAKMGGVENKLAMTDDATRAPGLMAASSDLCQAAPVVAL